MSRAEELAQELERINARQQAALIREMHAALVQAEKIFEQLRRGYVESSYGLGLIDAALKTIDEVTK